MRSLPAKPSIRDTPAGDVGEAHGAADCGDLAGGRAARIGCRDDRAGADSGDAVDRDVLPLQHAKDADVRDAVRESAAQREADARGR